MAGRFFVKRRSWRRVFHSDYTSSWHSQCSSTKHAGKLILSAHCLNTTQHGVYSWISWHASVLFTWQAGLRLFWPTPILVVGNNNLASVLEFDSKFGLSEFVPAGTKLWLWWSSSPLLEYHRLLFVPRSSPCWLLPSACMLRSRKSQVHTHTPTHTLPSVMSWSAACHLSPAGLPQPVMSLSARIITIFHL